MTLFRFNFSKLKYIDTTLNPLAQRLLIGKAEADVDERHHLRESKSELRKEVTTMAELTTEYARDIQCPTTPVDVLCKAEDIGLESYVRCLEERPQFCQFSVPFGYAHFCDSPVRVHICKKLGR